MLVAAPGSGRKAGDGCRALRGRPGGAGGCGDRGAGAGRVQADPGRVGGSAPRAGSRRGHAAGRAAASPAQQGQRLLPLPHPQGRRRRRGSPSPTSSSKASTRRRCRSTLTSSRKQAWRTSTKRAGSPSRSRASGRTWTRSEIAHALGLPDEQVRVDLPGYRRRVRRPRGHVGADHAGACALAARAARHPPAGQDHLEPRRVDVRPRQAPSHEALCEMGREAGWQAGGGGGQGRSPTAARTCTPATRCWATPR